MGWPALLAFAKTTLGSTVISAGAGALSSMAQTRNANKIANQGTDLTKLRDQANQAGFNPLTVLRATGGQGFKQNVSMGSGALASASFFSAFAGLGDRVAQRKQDNATLANTIANTKYTGILSKQAVTQISQPLIPTIPSDISGFTPENISSVRLPVAKSSGGLYVNNEVKPLWEQNLQADGTITTWIAGEDHGEMAVNLEKVTVHNINKLQKKYGNSLEQIGSNPIWLDGYNLLKPKLQWGPLHGYLKDAVSGELARKNRKMLGR